MSLKIPQPVAVLAILGCVASVGYYATNSPAPPAAPSAAPASSLVPVVGDAVVLDQYGDRWTVDLSELDEYVRSGYKIEAGQNIQVLQDGKVSVVPAREAQLLISGFYANAVGGDPEKVEQRKMAERRKERDEARAKQQRALEQQKKEQERLQEIIRGIK